MSPNALEVIAWIKTEAKTPKTQIPETSKKNGIIIKQIFIIQVSREKQYINLLIGLTVSIIYAEGEQKNVAREIKIALTTKMANGYIAGDTLSEEWKQRLENLGREKPRNDAMNFNNAVGTVVAHADQVTLQYRTDE